MINIPMYWLLIEAFLGGAIALMLHKAIERITFARFLRRFEVRVIGEAEKYRIEEDLKEHFKEFPAEDKKDES